MPRFFFDTDNAARLVTDDEGSECPDVDAARSLARRALSEIMLDMARHTDVAQCKAVVRNEAGDKLFTVRMTLTVEQAA